MNLKAFLIVFLLAVAAFVVATSLDADAARFGGGKSFGGKPSMSSPAPAPTNPGMQQRSMTNQPQGMPGSAAPKPGGMFGGMGGMFGGLLAGTLIGSMIGGGMGGGGGGGFLDIIILGLLIYFGFKLFARFRANRDSRPAADGPTNYQGGYSGNTEYRAEPDYRSGSGQQGQGYGMDWSTLQNKGGSDFTASPSDIPQGFDVEEFLRGAKMAFTRLQASWDRRDLKDIAQFTSPAVLKEIEGQMANDPQPSTTEILLINSQLINVTEFGGEQSAKVYFDVMLREDPRQQSSTQVREYWHFVRPISGGSWKLDGIQQVEG